MHGAVLLLLAGLVAALNTATGEVMTHCHKGHTSADVLAFFKMIDRSVARSLQIHVVLDNLSAHKGPEIKEWLGDPRRRRLAPALHADLELVGQPGGAVVQGADRPKAASGYLHQRAGAGRGDPALGRALERGTETLRLARSGRRDHRQGPPRAGRTHPSQIRDAPLARTLH